MVSSGANVIIWCYHVMLSSGMITHPFFFLKTSLTHAIDQKKAISHSLAITRDTQNGDREKRSGQAHLCHIFTKDVHGQNRSSMQLR
jgi:hypothetical protein